MKKLLLFSLIVLMIAPAARAQDVRMLMWGASQEDVRAYETAAFFAHEDPVMFFMDKIEGLQSLIGYEFFDNSLWRARIDITKKYTRPQDRINDYLKLKDMLMAEYGAPVREDRLWKDERYKHSPELWGWAVMDGDLKMIASWSTDTTDVALTLASQNRKTELYTTYKSRALSAAVAADKREGTLFTP